MAFFSRGPDPSNVAMTLSENASARGPDSLPAVLRTRDLALIIILVTIIIPDVRGMGFAGNAIFFYWFLAFFVFQLPSLCVFSWLLHQAPRHVPVYAWLLRLVNERWRSVLLFLMWWPGVLIALSTLSLCLSLLQHAFPSWLNTFPARCLAFAVLLICATLLTSLPLRLFRILLWATGLLYMGAFVLVIFAALTTLNVNLSSSGVYQYSALVSFPEHFSWSLFGLALLCLFGLNGPLLLDGEMRGSQRFLRGSTSYLWWGGLGSFLILLVITGVWIILDPTMQVIQSPFLQIIVPILDSRTITTGWILIFFGVFGCTLVYLLIFSRAFLLAARMGYLPRFIVRLNRSGTPIRAILTQSAMIAGAAVALFVVMPALLRVSLPPVLVNELIAEDQFSLLTSVASSLWCLLTALMFVFAFWLFLKKRCCAQKSRVQRLALPVLCLSGCLAALVCALAPLLPDWPTLFFSRSRWFPLVLVGVASSLALAWVISELPRRSALLREREKSLVREKVLREELQCVYTRERDLHNRLRLSYGKQQVLLLKQENLLDEVNRLYREQEQAATTDVVTGLLNHRAFIGRLEEEITRGQTETISFLLFFLDLDHFKTINDTWGHPVGDAVLYEVGQRLQEALHPGDIVGRYGGEEFMLIVANATIADAYEEGERLRRIIQTVSCDCQGTGETMTDIHITASIGVAAYGIHGTQSGELIEKADQAMYQAKLLGRDCVCVAGAQIPLVRSCALTTPASAHSSWEFIEGLANEPRNTTQVSVQALRALGEVIRARDTTTSTHSLRLIWLAEETGRLLGASPEDRFLMRLGGLCHDIGKIGIPDAILNKAGSLNKEEWAVMQKHPVIGAHIMEHVGGFFRLLAPVVQAHHERWDGHGYPQGLKEEEIPLASRVLGVADAYDAMISRRPYKDPMSVSAASAELLRNSGTQFDPTVVWAFLAVLKAPEPDWSRLETGLCWDSLMSENLLF